MDNKSLHDTFRRQLTNTHAVTVLMILLFEIIGYVVLVRSGAETFSLHNRYLWFGVVLPGAINLITHAVARILVSRPRIRRKRKNAAIITAALVTSLVVAVAHKEYIIACCAFVFPLVLSAMFNDRRLLNTSFIASLGILLCVAAAFELDGTAILETRLNLFVLLGFALIAYLCGRISIQFSRQSYAIIKEQAENNSRLMEGMQKDQMTGLYNHQTFLADLDSAMAEAAPDAPLCLAILDIDDFKQINDTFGHDYGDEVLLFLADALRRHCDEGDKAYRYGGEEFAILFNDKHVAEACDCVKRLLNCLREYRFGFADAPITFSAGVVEYTEGITRDAFFEAADRTMYYAKQSGKNRVFRSY